MKKENKEPLIRISKRGVMPWTQAWSVRIIAVILALIVSAIVIFAIVKMNPLKVYATMFEGAFGTEKRAWVTIRDP